MGGLVCMVHRNAKIQFKAVPTNQHDLREFDAQVREFYNGDYIAVQLVDDELAPEVCMILGKEEFTHQDRARLLAIADDLAEYE